MFKIGDKIVYPMHGAGVIEDLEIKEVLGERREYYILRMPIGDMKVMVPVENIEEVGVRDIITKEEIKDVFEILEDKKSKMPDNWNRRYRSNLDLIKTGDINQIAEVVRNLSLLDKEKGLSTGERKMLNDAKKILYSELVLASNLSVAEIEKLVDQAIFNEEI
ncbi:CarD family transcriptional regulator [Soehngenia longivitae]|uniref:CarD family transcriptional regulator n=1 Tax=Soehngenia longivitae TaxID=2562294 RepID=A0A4Z0DA78_9FIRM|nr:CarD family transcriptional regulator [Soehngenia longivitae]TFZ41787.1 CarD family transcriptional regulator [Soehngenia longivitae]